MFTAGFLTVLAIAFIIMKFNKNTLRRMLGYTIPIDITVTLFLTWLLAGTYSGMMAAIVGGILFSVILEVAKYFIGYERLQNKQCPHCQHKHLQWIGK